MAFNYYVDPVSGSNTAANLPLGWWKSAFTSGTGTQPPIDGTQTATGGTSNATAKPTAITFTVNSDEFGAGTQQDIKTGGDGAKSYGWSVLNTASADAIDVNVSNAGKMTIDCNAVASIASNAQFDVPFVYKTVTGDFDVEISFSDNADASYEGTGICVRDTTASAGEDFVFNCSLNSGGARYAYARNNVNSSAVDNTVAITATFLRITRNGNAFNLFYKVNSTDAWTSFIQYVRADFASSVQVGVFTYVGNISNNFVTQIDYFRIEEFSGTWSGGSGNLYWFGKSGTFQSETLTFTNGATCAISADLTYCAYLYPNYIIGATGDNIRVTKSPAIQTTGINGTWTNASADVTLSSAVTQTITLCESNWTAANGASSSTRNSEEIEGTNCVRIQMPVSPATETKYAYFATGALDLSAYQIVNFWMRSSDVGANKWKVCLCSDNAGATPVETITLGSSLKAVSVWHPIVWDKGSALSNNINSIAIYSDTSAPTGSQYVHIDAVFASKSSSSADCITLHHAISKSSAEDGGTEGWWMVRAIDGTTLKLASVGQINTETSDFGYGGATAGPIALYARKVSTITASANTGDAYFAFYGSGTAASNINVSGGWNSTDNTRDGSTMICGWNGYGYGIYISQSYAYYTFSHFGIFNFYYGLGCGQNVSYITLNNIHTIGHIVSAGLIVLTSIIGWDVTINCVHSNGTLTSGSFFNHSSAHFSHCKFNINALYCIYTPIYTSSTSTINGSNSKFYIGIMDEVGSFVYSNGTHWINIEFTGTSWTQTNTGLNSLYFASGTRLLNNIVFRGITFDTATSTAMVSVGSGEVKFINCSFGGSTEFTVSSTQYYDPKIYSIRHDKDDDNYIIVNNRGTIQSETSVRHTASGISWKMSPTSTNCDANVPLALPVAEVLCGANTLVTVKAWLRRTNTALTGRLICKGAQIAGVASDVSDSITAVADTWEEQTITFTPTVAGVVAIEVEAYGGTTYSLYVDDLTVSQA